MLKLYPSLTVIRFFKISKLSIKIFVLSIIALTHWACEEKEEVPVSTITNFTPTSGIPGTEVEIDGKNFSPNASDNHVTIGGVNAEIKSATEQSLRIIVAEGAVTGRIVVSDNSGRSATSSHDFSVLTKLVFTSFTPHSGEAGATLTLTGSGFSSALAANAVTIGGIPATVTAVTSTTLTIIAPIDGVTGNVEVKVNGQHLTSTELFRYVPKINEVMPSVVPIGAEITISGSGFSPIVANDKVYISGIQATIISATPTKIKARVPSGATTGSVSVKVNEVEALGPVVTIVKEAALAGGSGYDTGHDVIIDPSGNTYVVGFFQNEAFFDNEKVTGQAADIFIAKYDPEGILIWVRTAGGAYDDVAYSIDLDNSGDLLVAGQCSPNPSFGNISLSSNAGSFLAKVTPTGDFTWVKTFSTTGSQYTLVSDVTADSEGNPIIVGTYNGDLTVGAISINSLKQSSIFVAKLKGTDGSEIFLKGFESSLSSGGTSIEMTSEGNIILGGGFFGQMVFGASTFNSPSTTDLDAVLLKLTSDGELIWAKHFGGTGWNNIYDVKNDHAGDLIVTGYFGSSLNLPGQTLNAFGNENIFLTKLSADGGVKWGSVGASNYANGNAIAIDASNNIYVGGYFNIDITINGEVFAAAPRGQKHLFSSIVRRVNSNG